jgi:hypothetical protein
MVIHDCILTTKKDVLLVKNLFDSKVRKLFSGVILEHYNLDKLFKTSLVSIPDDMLEKTQRNAYFEKFHRKGLINIFLLIPKRFIYVKVP